MANPRIKHAAIIAQGKSHITLGDQGRAFGLLTKTGRVLAASFAGAPLVASVTFDTPFPNTNYDIVLTPEVSNAGTAFIPGISGAPTAGGFTITLTTAAATTNLTAVRWIAVERGESS